MLAVREEHRGKGIATKLVRMAIDAMIEKDADEVGDNPPTCTYYYMNGNKGGLYGIADCVGFRLRWRPRSRTRRQ